MNRIAITTIAAIALAPCGLWAQGAPNGGEGDAQANHGNSLWNIQRVSEGNLLSLQAMPARQFKVEDIITIVIREESSAASETSVDSEKRSNMDFTIDAFSRIIRNNTGPGFLVSPTFDTAPEFRYGYRRNRENDGSIERADRFNTRVAARVLDVKPNGNMVLEARREISVNGERRVITLTGVVSPQSVSSLNTVYSYDVASAKIAYNSDGPISDSARRGWLTHVMDFLDPF